MEITDYTTFYHNTRLDTFRFPQGAAPVESDVRIRLGAPKDVPVTSCLLCAECGWFAQSVEMRFDPQLCAFDVLLKLPSEPGLLYYWFIINTGSSLLYYSGDVSGVGEVTNMPPEKKFRISVYRQDYKTPDWFKRTVMYQIFPDRFNRSNFRGGLDRAGEKQTEGRVSYFHENWNEQPVYLPMFGNPYYQPCDYFGGDLKGIEEKLDYLEELGIGCIYLNPIFESFSNHRYNTADYKRVDPVLGDEADFVSLCEKAKERGIRVMLDGVFSHTGDDSRYFDRYHRYTDVVGAAEGRSSPYYDWYSFINYPTVYQSWWGFDSLPEVNEMAESYIKFIITDEDSVIKHWLRLGASGWRLDVADELPDDFIKILRRELKSAYPDAVLLGEVWEAPATKFSMGTMRQYVFGDELDSVMNYPISDAVKAFMLEKCSSDALREAFYSLRESEPIEFYYSNMNLLSSHDVPRIISLLGGAPDKDSGMSRPEQAKYQLTPEQYALGVQRFKTASLLQFTMPGVPCVYYGDEAGLTGLMDPFNRGTYPWEHENAELIQWHKTLSRIRRENPALSTGGCVVTSPDPNVLAAMRFITTGRDKFGMVTPDSFFIVLISNRSRPAELTLDVSRRAHYEGEDSVFCRVPLGEYEDMLTGERVQTRDTELKVTVPAHGGLLLRHLPRAE